MKREIRFRGKAIDNGKWVEGYIYQEIPETYTTYIMPSDLYNGYEYEVPDLYGDDMYRLQFEKYYEVIPESVGQYTGLKDNNGQEIYEGDIIVWSGTLDGCIFNHVCEVIFDLYEWCGWVIYSSKQRWAVPFGEHGCNPNEVNIVGNVYENKELLKTN